MNVGSGDNMTESVQDLTWLCNDSGAQTYALKPKENKYHQTSQAETILEHLYKTN